MKFEVGDRVAVYHVWKGRLTGKVDAINERGHLSVIEDGFYSAHEDGPFHPKQCRKLVKRERQRIWVGQKIYRWGNGHVDHFMEARFIKPSDSEKPADGRQWREFVEVRKKKCPTTP